MAVRLLLLSCVCDNFVRRRRNYLLSQIWSWLSAALFQYLFSRDRFLEDDESSQRTANLWVVINGVYITCDKTNYTKVILRRCQRLSSSGESKGVLCCIVIHPLDAFQPAHRLSFSRKSQQHTTESIKARVRSGAEVWQLRRNEN